MRYLKVFIIILIFPTILIAQENKDNKRGSIIKPSIEHRNKAYAKYQEVINSSESDSVYIGLVTPIFNYDNDIIQQASIIELTLMQLNSRLQQCQNEMKEVLEGENVGKQKEAKIPERPYSFLVGILAAIFGVLTVVFLIMFLQTRGVLKYFRKNGEFPQKDSKQKTKNKKGEKQEAKTHSKEIRNTNNGDADKQLRRQKIEIEDLKEKVKKRDEELRKVKDESWKLKTENKNLSSQISRLEIDVKNAQTKLSINQQNESTAVTQEIKQPEPKVIVKEVIKEVPVSKEFDYKQTPDYLKLENENKHFKEVFKKVEEDIKIFKAKKTDMIQKMSDLEQQNLKLQKEKDILKEKMQQLIALKEQFKKSVNVEPVYVYDLPKEFNLIETWKDKIEKLFVLINNKNEKIEQLEQKIKENTKTEEQIRQEELSGELALIEKLNALKGTGAISDDDFTGLKEKIVKSVTGEQ